jgi:hypothetical protein
LADVAPEIASRVPLTSWFRFRRAVENTSTALVVIEQEPFAKSCASLVLRFKNRAARWSSLFASGPDAAQPKNCCATPSHARLLRGLQFDVEIETTRSHSGSAQRKPAQSAHVGISTQALWAG